MSKESVDVRCLTVSLGALGWCHVFTYSVRAFSGEGDVSTEPRFKLILSRRVGLDVLNGFWINQLFVKSWVDTDVYEFSERSPRIHINSCMVSSDGVAIGLDYRTDK